MKNILIFLLLISPSVALGEESRRIVPDLSEKDLFQAEQWLQLIRGLWEVEDYTLLRHYCRKIIEFYPETHYAEEAKEFMEKTEKPGVNARRVYRRQNPALFPAR